GGRLDAFAKAVLGAGFTPAKATQVKKDFSDWVKQFGDFMDRSLPTSPWGPARLDAFGMIFNRVAARDLGLEKSPHNNFRLADAPVSYPFLWNASRQDHTQWNGAVPNGLFIRGLVRNTGEVYGVFARFAPTLKHRETRLTPTIIDFSDNSADFDGLQTLEEKIATLKPPPWPRDIWPINDDLAKRGAGLFTQYCAECHAQRQSGDLPHAWATPVRAVGTDPKMATNATRTSDPGIYLGALRPPPAVAARFANPASTAEMLGTSVIGSLFDEAFSLPITPKKIDQSGVWRAVRKDLEDLLPDEKLDNLARLNQLDEIKSLLRVKLANMFVKPRTADAGAAYESRVLYGIWATAPYLHNGSVPSLWELMLPPERRSTTFKVGSRRFDPKNVGYATDETPFKSGIFVADPENANGNGNGGHVYGKDLSDDDRWTIVEYLKTL
ncbi:MAG: di-heme-cytochrome C peroxidase, partial [Burkholderiales bacterium]